MVVVAWVCVLQELPAVTCGGDANVYQLFLSRHDHMEKGRGWYVTRSLRTDDLWSEGNIVAWGKSRSGEPHTWPNEFFMSAYTSYKGYVQYEKHPAPLLMQAYIPWLEVALNDAINGFTYGAM